MNQKKKAQKNNKVPAAVHCPDKIKLHASLQHFFNKMKLDAFVIQYFHLVMARNLIRDVLENLDNSLVCELLSATMGCSHRLLL